MTYGEGEMTAMDDMTKETDAGIGHNQPLDPDGERGLEAIRDYDTSVAKEKTSRDEAIAAAARYGTALIAGRARCKTNNEFGDWIKEQGLASGGMFWVRQERQAAVQIVEITAHVAKETVDSISAVNPFEDCPNSRPTHIMTWWRGKHTNLLTMTHANTIGERAAKILRDHRDLVDARKNDDYDYSAIMEALERDPFGRRSGEDVVNKLEIEAGLRAAPVAPPPATCAQDFRRAPLLRPRRPLRSREFRRQPTEPRPRLFRRRYGGYATSSTSCRCIWSRSHRPRRKTGPSTKTNTNTGRCPRRLNGGPMTCRRDKLLSQARI
jgi:hypothetical protein